MNLDLRSVFNPRKQRKNPTVPSPGDQGSLQNGTLDQQQPLFEVQGSFQKRLKANMPMLSMTWLGGGARKTGSQSRDPLRTQALGTWLGR